jgi:MtN3 and saliva related transmembrane protein
MLFLLAAGLSLWMLYGVLRGDGVIVVANAVSLALLGGNIFFKLTERH